MTVIKAQLAPDSGSDWLTRPLDRRATGASAQDLHMNDELETFMRTYLHADTAYDTAGPFHDHRNRPARPAGRT